MDTPLTYDEIGASLATPLPAGYRHLTLRVPLGPVSLSRAARAVLTFDLHRAAGVRVTASAPQAAAVGVAVTSGIGPLTGLAPCRVVAVVEAADRAGFAYGTLPGHPFAGEEAFVVERDPTGQVWFTVTAFSRPRSLPARLAGPLVPIAQRAFARRLGRILRRLAGAAG